MVEDEPDVLDVLQYLLIDAGHEVVPARNGIVALAALQSDRVFDILVSDVVLPGRMSGVNVARTARRLRPGLPVLLVSGYPSDMLADYNAIGELTPDQTLYPRRVAASCRSDRAAKRCAVVHLIRLPSGQSPICVVGGVITNSSEKNLSGAMTCRVFGSSQHVNRFWSAKLVLTPYREGVFIAHMLIDGVAIGTPVARRASAQIHTSGITHTAAALTEAGIATICIETRQAKAAMGAMPNKTDRNDARGIAQIMRTGW